MFRRLATAGLLAALLSGAGCVPVPTAKTTTAPRPAPARDKAQGANASGSLVVRSITLAVVKAVTVTQAPSPLSTTKAPTGAPKATPRTSAYRHDSPPLIKARVGGLARTNEADADEDALIAAADLIAQKLAELDPPVDYRPTPNEVRHEFVRRDTRTVRPPDPEELARLVEYKEDTNRVFVEYDVEVYPEQVRNLRTRDRVGDGLRIVGGFTAIFLAGYLFLRWDERTKGYLTRWLAIGAVALAAGAAAALYLV